MYTVYSEKDIFENIIVLSDQTPNWYNILCNHAEVCLNMTDEELASEEKQGTAIFEYIMANGGRSPVALKDFFDSIYEDNSITASKPRAAFFLNCSKLEAAAMQSSYGVIIQSGEAINDDLLTASYKRKLLKGEEIKDAKHSGWKSLLNFPFPPSNSMVISDNYLLQSTERVGNKYEASGKANVLWMLDALLPESLAVPYHITILSEDNDQPEAWRNKLAGDLKTEINILRGYDINVEIVFIKSELLHERILLMNYVNSSCEHGFYVFKAADGKTVHVVNKIQVNSYFSSLSNVHGDTEFSLASRDLRQIKEICTGLSTHLHGGAAVYRGDILGDCNPNKSLKNRLINDV